MDTVLAHVTRVIVVSEYRDSVRRVADYKTIIYHPFIDNVVYNAIPYSLVRFLITKQTQSQRAE